MEIVQLSFSLQLPCFEGAGFDRHDSYNSLHYFWIALASKVSRTICTRCDYSYFM